MTIGMSVSTIGSAMYAREPRHVRPYEIHAAAATPVAIQSGIAPIPLITNLASNTKSKPSYTVGDRERLKANGT